MEIKAQNIDKKLCVTPTNWAEQKGIKRQHVYVLMENNTIDWVIVDGVKFVYKTQTTNSYIKQK